MSTIATRHRRSGPVGVAQSQFPSADTRPAPEVTTQDIRSRAYELYLARCASGVPGDELSDWLCAERELCAEAWATRRSARGNRLRGDTLLRGED